MSTDPTRSLWDAWAAAILEAGSGPTTVNANGQVVPILAGRKVYRGSVPGNAPLAYYLFGIAPTVADDWYNGERGSSGTARIHCWAPTADLALRIYEHLQSVLDDVPLEVAGHQWVQGRLSKNGPVSDTDGTAWQIQADYRFRTLEVAA